MKTGIYQIRNLVNGKCYIGGAAGVTGFNGRWRTHRHQLNMNCHHSIALQRAWNKYGVSSFVFEVIEVCPPQICLEREQHWLDDAHPAYNTCLVAGNCLGRKLSDVTKKKLADAKRGKISYWRGKKLPTIVRNKMSQNHADVRGENNPASKLDAQLITQLRQMSRNGMSQRKLAKFFQISQSQVCRIVNNESWKV